jgi:hypothetical protein
MATKNSGLYPGLVLCSSARGQDDGAVVLREVVVRPLHARLVAARGDDTAFELIGHDGRADSAKELEGLVARDPVRTCCVRVASAYV